MTCAKRLQTILDSKVYPLPLIWLESSHTIKGMMKKIPRKIGVADTMWDKLCSLIGQNRQNTLSQRRQGGKQLDFAQIVFILSFYFSYILFILLVSYFNYECCTLHLEKMFVRFFIIFDVYCSLAPTVWFRISGQCPELLKKGTFCGVLPRNALK